MPVSINAPNFWNTMLEDVINRSERKPQSDGSYTFLPGENQEANTSLDYLYPSNPLGMQKQFSTDLERRDYVHGLMGRELSGGATPYNSKQSWTQGQDDPLLKQLLRDWARRNGISF